MVEYGLTKAGRLGKLDVSGDLGLKQLVVIVLLELVDDLHGEQQACVIHGYEYYPYWK